MRDVAPPNPHGLGRTGGYCGSCSRRRHRRRGPVHQPPARQFPGVLQPSQSATGLPTPWRRRFRGRPRPTLRRTPAASARWGQLRPGGFRPSSQRRRLLMAQDSSGDQRMMVWIRSARGVSVCCDQALVAAARASADPARTCGPPWASRVSRERNARPLRARTRMSVAAFAEPVPGG